MKQTASKKSTHDAKPARKRGRPALPDKSSTIPVNRRLGYRVSEFAKMLGVSYVTVWRHIKSGEIETVTVGGVKLIPRSHAIKSGLIDASDTL